VNARRFTGERLHAGDELFSVDIARHQAAYQRAREHLHRSRPAGRILDLGCGSGHGTRELAGSGALIVGVDRVAPDPIAESVPRACQFVCADLYQLPFRGAVFDLVASFQVIEHLENPSEYLAAIARLLEPDGLAMLTTPNLLMSDRANPYHVHEYEAAELEARLLEHFAEVELFGVGMRPPVREYMAARSRRIRRILRLDPLRIRDHLPRALSQTLFARFALLVRRGTRRAEGVPEVTWRDFPIGPAEADSIDLMALCRRPR